MDTTHDDHCGVHEPSGGRGTPEGDRPAAPVQVLVVSPPSPIWGAQVYLLDTVAPLRARGVHLTLATPPGSPLADAWLERGFPLLETAVRLHGGLRRRDGTDRRPPVTALARDAMAMVPAAARLARLARGFDVVHSYALRSHLEVGAAARLARRPAVLDLVDIVRPGVGRTVLRTAVRLATLTVANSAATAATVGMPSRVRVIQPGIDLGRFRPGPRDAAVRASLTSDPDAPLVAIIGRIDRLKGIQYLVEAMGMLEGRAAGAHLAVVGDAGTGPPEFARELREQAMALLGDRVRFTGRRTDVPDIVRNVDVVVNASKAEPFGLSVLEAQACGTAVIGTNAGGIPEFVEHGVTGLLVPPFEAAPLAAALQRVLTDCSLVASMTAEAVRRAHPARGLEAQYDELAAMYRSVVGAPAGRQRHPDSVFLRSRE